MKNLLLRLLAVLLVLGVFAAAVAGTVHLLRVFAFAGG
jgi:hypothetical protein